MTGASTILIQIIKEGGNSAMHGSHYKKPIHTRQRLTLLFVSLLLVIGVGIGATFAYIRMQTQEERNVFTPGRVACAVEETFDGSEKKDVSIKNTGNTEAYIRAAVHVTWMRDDENPDAADQTVMASVPQEGIDYTITYAENAGWLRIGDYWYYQSPVEPGDSTAVLVTSCRLAEGGTVPQGYHLSVEIVSSAIQSLPNTVPVEKWNVEIADGQIIGAAVESEVTGE